MKGDITLFRISAPIAVLIALALVVLAASPVLANGAALLSSGDSEYLWSTYDLLQDGQSPPTSTQTMTEQEFHLSLSQQETEQAPEMSSRLIFTLTPYAAPFGLPYSLPYTQLVPRGVPLDVVYLHENLPPMLEVGDAFDVGDWFHADLVLDHTPGIRYMVGNDAYVPWDMDTVFPGMEFPTRSYLAVSTPHTSLAIGRFKTGIGYGYFGNTFLNGKAPYYDHLEATYYGGDFKYFYLMGTSQSFLTVREGEIQRQDWGGSGGVVFDEPIKTFVYHRVEWHPAGWITAGLGEMNIIGGKSPDWYHILPFDIWHNTYSHGSSNVMAMLDLSVVPFKGLQVFGEFTMDDFRLGMEAPESKPPAFAYQAGARYVLPFSDETKHAIGIEFTHVDPWTYNRWQPYLTMYQRQIRNQDLYLDIPLGYLYGGDLNHYGLYYQAVNRNGFRLDLSYDHLDKGPIYLGLDELGNPYYSGYMDIENSGPYGHGIVEKRDTFRASLVYPLPWYGLELMANAQWGFIQNFQHVEGASESIGMLMIGVKWSY